MIVAIAPAQTLLDGGDTLSANNLLGRIDYFTTTIRSGSVGTQVTPGAGREILATVRRKL